MTETGVDIRPMDDLGTMLELAARCGLEVGGRGGEGVVAAWGAFAGDRLVGSLCLERHGDLDTPEWLAVDEAYRRRGIAAALYAELEREARRRGIARLWVTARAPRFFLAHGFEPVTAGPERDALLGGCLDCEQFAYGCDPRALTKSLEGPGPRGL
jgi:GNAT superfamily N-acetyltransferase